MKLSEITKRDFLNTLKDPHKALIRRTIKEFRKDVASDGWKVYSRYDKGDGKEGEPHFRISVFRKTLRYGIDGKPLPNSSIDFIFEKLKKYFPYPPFDMQDWEGPALNEITVIIFAKELTPG